jgi:hypothetical protein
MMVLLLAVMVVARAVVINIAFHGRRIAAATRGVRLAEKANIGST